MVSWAQSGRGNPQEGPMCLRVHKRQHRTHWQWDVATATCTTRKVWRLAWMMRLIGTEEDSEDSGLPHSNPQGTFPKAGMVTT